MTDEKCRFFLKPKRCHILVGMKCDGTKTNCSFYKTNKQFQRDCDKSIIINRRKHNCENCRYSAIPCELSRYCEENDDDA